jgi:hypothetical protein
MTKTTKRILQAVVVVLVLLTVVGFGWFRSLSHDLPALHPSEEADALARAMMASVNHQAWLETGAVTWTFRGQNVHRWDRRRNLALVAWEVDGPSLMEVFLDLDSKDGIVKKDHVELTQKTEPEERSAALQSAWEYWANDSFWLHPIAKLFDEGTSRGLVTPQEGEFEEGLRGLLVTYGSGGVTPGDSYLWLVDSNSRPVAWRMWTQILPIQGLETSWEGWQELSTGAFVATKHQTPLGALGLSELRGGHSLSDLQDGDDPFAEDFERLAMKVGQSEGTSEAGPAASP